MLHFRKRISFLTEKGVNFIINLLFKEFRNSFLFVCLKIAKTEFQIGFPYLEGKIGKNNQSYGL